MSTKRTSAPSARHLVPEGLPPDPTLTYDPQRSTLLQSMGSLAPTRLGVPASVLGPADDRPAPIVLPPLPAADIDLLEPLAQGGFGDVWRGRQRSLDRSVAVKRLRDDRLEAADDEQRRNLEAMFRHEALTTAHLEHPNIVPVYQLGTDSTGRSVLGMKIVRGRRWSELIREQQHRPIDELLADHLPILIDVAQAVAYAHSRGVLHRDLKPQQVMVGEFGEVQVMDWGLALLFGETAPRVPVAAAEGAAASGSFTSSGVAGPAGTPCFMAPEQTRDDGCVLGPWTDLYLLGGCLYFLLTGQPTHGGENGLVAFARAARGEVVPAEERAPERRPPTELCDLARGVLAADPEDRRPATVQEFVEALRAYLGGASRKQRSRRLADGIEDRLTAGGGGEGGEVTADYDTLARCLEGLREAEALWPENPRIESIRLRVRRRYAEVALARSDLALARLQASHLADDEQGTLVRRQIDRAIGVRRRQARQRRLALAALVLVTLVGALGFAVQERRNSERLRQQRDAAQSARDDAEGLMSFMLDDLWHELLPIGRVDLLEPVARRAKAYYAGRDPEVLGPAEQTRFAAMFDILGDTFHFQGDTEAAVEAYARAADIFRRQVEGGSPTAPEQDPRRALAEALMGLASSTNDLGQGEEALTIYDEAFALNETLLTEAPADLELRISQMELIDGRGIALYDLARLDEAHRCFEEAVRLGEAIDRDAPSEAHSERLPGALTRLAVTWDDLGHPDRALAPVEHAAQLRREGVARHLEQTSQWLDLALVVAVQGEILAHLERFDESVEVLRGVEPRLNELETLDPANVEVRYVHSLVLLQLGRSESARGRAESARRAWNRLLEVLEPVREDSTLAYLDDSVARALLYLGRRDEARPIAEALIAKGWRHQGFEELWNELGGAD